jgi:serine/threonine protein kinase
MPWNSSTLNKHPSHLLDWIAIEGRRILEALQYLHSHPDGGFAHMDVKAMNVFVDHNNRCFLGDFGSCKPLGKPITSCSIKFCWEDVPTGPPQVRPLHVPAHDLDRVPGGSTDLHQRLLRTGCEFRECGEGRRSSGDKNYVRLNSCCAKSLTTGSAGESVRVSFGLKTRNKPTTNSFYLINLFDDSV